MAAGACCLAHAQGPVDGAVYAIVRDAHGQPVSGAELLLTQVATELRIPLTTSRFGTAVWPHLAPGSYVASVASGTEPLLSAPVEVTLGDATELEIGPRAITVAEQDPLPGLTTGDPDQDGDGLLSVRGLASTGNSVVIDGVEANQSFGSVPVGTGSEPGDDPDDDARGGNGPGTLGQARGRAAGASTSFAQGAVREFRLATRYTALTGHAGGSIMTAVSRSGTTHVHGSGLYTLRSSILAATDPLSIATSYTDGLVTAWEPKPQDLRQTFAATIGGPLLPKRLRHVFYFYAGDLQYRDFPAVSSPQYAGFFTLSPVQAALLTTRGVNPAATNAALNYLSSLTGTVPRSSLETIHFAKLDWHRTPRQGFGVQYNRLRWSRPAGAINAAVVARGRASLGNTSGAVDSIVPRWTLQWKTHLSNELRLQAARDLQYEQPQTNLPQEPTIGPAGYAPEIAIAPDGFLFGTPAALSQAAYPDERRYQIADTATLVRGRQLLQLGVDTSFVSDRIATLPNAAGTFRYDSTAVNGHAGGLVDWITDYTFNVHAYPNGGCPSIYAATHDPCFHAYTQSFGLQTVAFDTQEWAGFIQDRWRVRRGLTVDAGLRYEYELLPFPQQPNAVIDAVFGATGATSVFPEDRNNLGPRVGIAWELPGRSHIVVRAGYGDFFGRLPGTTIRSALANTALAASTTHVRITPSTVTACPQVANQGFGYVCSYLAAPPAAVAATTSAMVFDRRFRLPVIQQASFGVETTVSPGTTVSASYLMNLDNQLQGSTDINIAPTASQRMFQLQGGSGRPGVQSGESFVIPVYTARVSPLFGPITDIRSDVNGTYHGLMVGVDRQPRHGLGLRASYTWSKAIDYGQGAGATPQTNAQFDPFSIRYDKGLSSLNHPQSLHLTAIWEPRVKMAEHWLDRVADGWNLAPILAMRSGRPYTLQIFGGTSLAGGRDTINGSGGATYLPTVGRNTLRLPASANVDLRVVRTVALGGRERRYLRLGAEIFNVSNHQNVSSVQQRAFLPGVPGTTTPGVTPLIFQDAAAIASEGLTTPAFGTPTAASTNLLRARQVELTLRLEF